MLLIRALVNQGSALDREDFHLLKEKPGCKKL